MSKKWNKEELAELYETHTLEEIGQKFGVSRERVRQVMDKFGIVRRASNPVKGSKHQKSADDLLLAELKCPACGGKKYCEYEHGLIRIACTRCKDD